MKHVVSTMQRTHKSFEMGDCMNIGMIFVIRGYLLRAFVLIGVPLGLLFAGSGVSNAEPMTFRFVQPAENQIALAEIGLIENAIAAEGDITAETPAQFQAFLDAHTSLLSSGFLNSIYLNSGGGSLRAGLELGEMIRSKELQTVVGRPDNNGQGVECDSACTFAFLGGLTRNVQLGARFGVHRFTSGQATEDEQELQEIEGELTSYIAKMGVSLDMFTLMTTAPPDGILYLDQQTLDRLNITTHDMTTARIFDEAGQTMLELSEKNGADSATAQQIEFYCSSRHLRARTVTIDSLSSALATPTEYDWSVVLLPKGSYRAIFPSSEVARFSSNSSTTDFAVPSVISERLISASRFSLDLQGTGNVLIFDIGDDIRPTIQTFVSACSGH